jgi:hypothetical protein
MKPRTWPQRGSLALLVLVLSACAWQRSYLQGAVDRATQAEVAERLGPPHAAWTLTTGETLWTYQYGVPRASEWGGVTIVGPGLTFGSGSACTEYVLLFDRQQMLRAWLRQACRPTTPSSHGGRRRRPA